MTKIYAKVKFYTSTPGKADDCMKFLKHVSEVVDYANVLSDAPFLGSSYKAKVHQNQTNRGWTTTVKYSLRGDMDILMREDSSLRKEAEELGGTYTKYRYHDRDKKKK